MSSSIDVSISPTDSDPAPSSSFGSTNESIPRDKAEQLIRKLSFENKQLQLRVLGVNELARLLQDRSEKVKVLEDKNKRLEVAVVRLENRCANLEQRLRAEGGAPLSGPKSMQPPSIPGPSRQILEGLMKENSELKKALNAMQKKGPSGYLEAVKTAQLEEVIEQQKQELEFLRNQVNMLTTTPLPPSSSGGASQEGGASDQQKQPGSSSPAGDLRRQIIKMQHSLKVKDRFCSLLSDQVASLQDRLREMSLTEASDGLEGGGRAEPKPESTTRVPPGEGDPPYVPEGATDAINSSPLVRQARDEFLKKKEELEARYGQVFEEQKETLQKERQEHTAIVEKLQKADQELKKMQREIAALDKRCEDLQFHNTTLLDDKKQLQETLDQMKAAGARGGDGGGLERELRELQDSLHQKVMEHSEELRNKDKEMQQLRMILEDTEYKYVIAHSKLSEIEKEHEQRVTDLQDKLDYMEINSSPQQTEIEELRETNRKLKMEISSLKSKPSGPPPAAFPLDVVPSAFPLDVAQSAFPSLMLPRTMQNMVTVKDGAGGYTDPTVIRPRMAAERCETKKLQTYLPPELISRNPEEEDPQPPTSQQGPPQQHGGSGSPHPSTLPFRSQNPPPRHPSPSPSPAATPHPLAPGAGRRSPVSPIITQTGTQPHLTHQHHYATHPVGYHLSASPVVYPQQMRHGHPTQPLFDPATLGHSQPGQPYHPPAGFGGPGGRGVPPQQSGSPVPQGSIRPPLRPQMDNEPYQPHGYRGDPSSSAHHHHHTPQRRS